MHRAAALLLLALLPFASGCRRQKNPPPAPAPSASVLPSASAPPLAAASASSPAPTPPALLAPWSAARSPGGWLAAGVPRDDDPGWLALRGSLAGEVESFVLKGSSELGRAAALEVVASRGGIGVHGEDKDGRGVLWRAPSWEGLKEAPREALQSSLCATEDRLVGVLSGATPALKAWPFGPGEPATLLEVKGGGSSSLFCGQRRAYLLVDDGKTQRLWALEGERVRGPIALDSKDDERGLVFSVEQDTLHAARIDGKGQLALRRWPADAEAPGPWTPLADPAEPGSSLELLLARPPRIALVLGRHLDADDCKNGENFHTVAELRWIDLETRALARQKVNLDTWRCGAEAGPFGGGQGGEGVVVSWPRGVGAGCARQGAKQGGVGFLEVPMEGAPRGGKVEAPSWDLLDLGCEGGRCGALTLARGEGDGCWAPEDPRVNRPRWVAYP